MRYTSFFIFTGCLFFLFNQELKTQTSIYGKVLDKLTLEPLPYATIFDSEKTNIVYADEQGDFRLFLSENSSMVYASYVGYKIDSFFISSDNNNQIIEFSLRPSLVLPTIEVHAPSDLYHNTSSILTPKVSTLIQTPSILGETDLLKSLSLLPGISTGIEGTSGIQIRGGNPNQTHLLIDGISLYNVNHIGGFLSAVPDFGIKGITIYKGGVPPKFGGRLSGVLDVLLKEGRRDTANYQYVLGMGTLQVGAEGPIGKKSSFLLNARGAWPTLLFNLFSGGNYKKAIQGSHRNFGLYDFLGKYVFYGRRTKISLSSFVSGDNGFVQDDLENGVFLDEFNWNNFASALKIRHLINNKSILKGSIQRSVYDYNFAPLIRFVSQQGFFQNYKENNLKLTDWSIEADYSYSFSNMLSFKFGVKTIYHNFNTNIIEEFKSPDEEKRKSQSIRQSAWESGSFIEINYNLKDKVQLMGGTRISNLSNVEQSKYAIEPRLRASLHLYKDIFLNAGYDRHTQYLHQITTDIALFPNDIWLLADNINKPEKSEQLYLGIGGNTKNNNIQWSVEAYIKRMDNLLRVLPGVESNSTLSSDFNNNIAQKGEGKSQGVEFFINKKEGNFQCWLAYTLSFSDRRYLQINDNLWFPFTFDRKNDISLQASYQLNEKWLLVSNFVYQTGYAFTAPLTTTAFFDVFSSFNNARYPAFHRLNIGATKKWLASKKPWQHRQLTFSLYNVYNRANPFSIEINPIRIPEEGVTPSNTNYKLRLKVFTRSLFPLLPGISYKVNIMPMH